MSGVFACACSLHALKTMADWLAPPSDVTSNVPGARLEIIFFAAAAGMSLAPSGSSRCWSAVTERRPDNGEMEVLSNSYHYVNPANPAELAHLESLIRKDFEQCHPGETLEDVKRRASFSKEDKGLLRDWMAVAAMRAAADRATMPPALAA